MKLREGWAKDASKKSIDGDDVMTPAQARFQRDNADRFAFSLITELSATYCTYQPDIWTVWTIRRRCTWWLIPSRDSRLLETVRLNLAFLVNPFAADQAVVKSYVKPLLEPSGYSIKAYETQSVGDAARIAREISEQPASTAQGGARTVVLAGGDGTMHEFIEGIYSLGGKEAKGERWELVMIPVGTVSVLSALNARAHL